MADPNATPLSVSLPMAAREHAGKPVANYLWGLLPDNDRVLARWARDYQCSAADVFGLLAGVGADVAGAAQYLLPDVAGDKAGLGEFQPLADSDIAELLRAVRLDATAWHPRAQGRWSLAGAQAKLALAFDGPGRWWGIPSGSRPTTHILKLAVPRLNNHDIERGRVSMGAFGACWWPDSASMCTKGGPEWLSARRLGQVGPTAGRAW